MKTLNPIETEPLAGIETDAIQPVQAGAQAVATYPTDAQMITYAGIPVEILDVVYYRKTKWRVNARIRSADWDEHVAGQPFFPKDKRAFQLRGAGKVGSGTLELSSQNEAGEYRNVQFHGRLTAI